MKKVNATYFSASRLGTFDCVFYDAADLASQKCYINASGHGMHCRPYGVRPWRPCCLCIQLLVDYWQQKHRRQNYEPCFAPKSDAGFSRLPPLEIELLVSSLHDPSTIGYSSLILDEDDMMKTSRTVSVTALRRCETPSSPPPRTRSVSKTVNNFFHNCLLLRHKK